MYLCGVLSFGDIILSSSRGTKMFVIENVFECRHQLPALTPIQIDF